MQVAKWGNSLAIRIPVAAVKALELAEGDDIELRIAAPRVFEIAKRPGKDEILDALREFRGRMPADFKLDRVDANER